jgi:ATP-dependent Clp protease protease subunit
MSAPGPGFDDKELERRIVRLTGEIDDERTNVVTAKLLFLQFQDAKKDIHLLVNSPGGSVTAGLAIYDTIQFVKPAVATCAVAQVAGMALLLLAAGRRGKRTATPHARLVMTDLWGTPQPGPDMEIQAQEIARLKDAVDEIFVKATGRSRAEIEEARKKERAFTLEEALAFGLIDELVAGPPLV